MGMAPVEKLDDGLAAINIASVLDQFHPTLRARQVDRQDLVAGRRRPIPHHHDAGYTNGIGMYTMHKLLATA